MPGVCPRCLREVYFAEEKLALGKVWHTFCFTCKNCRKLLDSCTIATHSGEIFCRNCFTRLFSISTRPLLSVSTRGKQEIITDTKKRETLPLKNSTSDYFSDCCCYCCTEDCSLLSNRGNIQNLNVFPSEKSRFRGGGEQEEIFPLEKRNQFCKKENLNLDVVSSVITVCNPLQNSSNGGHWINRHQSASQSTFGCQSCSKSQLARPLTTPSTGIPEVCRRFNKINNNNSQSGLRRAGSPRRFSNRQLNQDKIDQPHNQFLQYQTSKVHEVGSNKKAPQPAVRRYLLYPPLPPHYIPRRRVSFCNNISEENTTCRDQEGHLTMRNVASDDILKEEHRSYYNLDSEDSNFCDCNEGVEESERIEFVNRNCTSLETIHEDYCNGRMRGGCGGGGGSGCCGGKSRYEGDLDGDYDHEGELDGGRRIEFGSSSGSGSCGCSSRSTKNQPSESVGCCTRSEDNKQGIYGHSSSLERQKPKKSGGCCLRSEDNNQRTYGSNYMHSTLHETCPPRQPDSCNSFKTPSSADAYSPLCSGRKGCCPPVGSPPVCKKKPRCNSPCGSSTQKCGGGGCCGGGCRGGCGKPGQQCLPSRSCTNPPCHSRTVSGGSPCLPPRPNAREPPCCKIPQLMGISRHMSGKSGYRSKSPGRRNTGGDGCSQKNDEGNDDENDDYDVPKVPPGCECLGGGVDCQRCGRKVYHAEMQIASGVPFHNICFSCFCCRKPLESLTYQENCGEIYCKQCYIRNFGPQGYGYGLGAGVLQTPM